MADKYRFKRIKEEIYRISFATDENINFTRHNLSVATIFSTFPFIWPLFEETNVDETNVKSSVFSRDGDGRRNRRRNFVFTRINVARYSSGGWLLIDQGHGQAGADFLNSFFSALLIKSLIKATSINQNSVSDCCGRVLRCSRQRWGGEDCSRKEVKKTRARHCPVLMSTNRPIKKSSRPQTFAV